MIISITVSKQNKFMFLKFFIYLILLISYPSFAATVNPITNEKINKNISFLNKLKSSKKESHYLIPRRNKKKHSELISASQANNRMYEKTNKQRNKTNFKNHIDLKKQYSQILINFLNEETIDNSIIILKELNEKNNSLNEIFQNQLKQIVNIKNVTHLNSIIYDVEGKPKQAKKTSPNNQINKFYPPIDGYEKDPYSIKEEEHSKISFAFFKFLTLEIILKTIAVFLTLLFSFKIFKFVILRSKF